MCVQVDVIHSVTEGEFIGIGAYQVLLRGCIFIVVHSVIHHRTAVDHVIRVPAFRFLDGNVSVFRNTLVARQPEAVLEFRSERYFGAHGLSIDGLRTQVVVRIFCTVFIVVNRVTQFRDWGLFGVDHIEHVLALIFRDSKRERSGKRLIAFWKCIVELAFFSAFTYRDNSTKRSAA